MKTLHRTCAATVLSLALVVSAFAGQISSPGAASPPPPPPETSTSATTEITTTLILTIISLVPTP